MYSNVDRPATRWTTYVECFIPVCERLIADGRIGAWGITGIGIPECVLVAVGQSPRPSAAFRALTRELGTSAAALAHRYALSMPGVDTVVLGCKNRKEVLECVAAAEAGPLEPAIMARIDEAFAA